MSTQPLLKVEHLTMRFGGLVAVNDLSFDVQKGNITALIGQSACDITMGIPVVVIDLHKANAAFYQLACK